MSGDFAPFEGKVRPQAQCFCCRLRDAQDSQRRTRLAPPPPHDAPQLEAGVSRFFSRENVDKYYDLKKEIGSGNFSIVKLAVNRKTGEEVAVKIIEKKRVGTKKDMLQTEIDILQKVHHPNVVALKELFETSTHIYLVMELYALTCPGPGLTRASG